MLIDFIRQVYANKNFKIKDNFEFVEFDDLSPETTKEESPVPEQIEIWAAIKIFFDGKTPDSYKVLNLTIGDWVAVHDRDLIKVLHQKLKEHFIAAYPNSDTSEVHEESESSIWEDQLDYMPRIDEKEQSMIIEIELVLDSEITE
jgi:hypothetical protein